MAKHQKLLQPLEHESGRGSIKDNALKAIVTSSLFRTRTEKPKKGKGSYNRKQKGQTLKGIAPFDYLQLVIKIH
ncbi:ribosome alternative rescue factor ArfA [Shewanella pneumatophori]|uniref:Ribosome alternative rescue factor ArfA n=1 Tax=Shewanella pneumatophori TaxID=314092 RepID=A0A9X1ZH16_9GAMM|nr:ribosome alternative rescue factor ArfA [Shewanella pneumatophori]MCL1137653.1 ribosome alternative rescue factor ArfA [Shewanella pneumatophori]